MPAKSGRVKSKGNKICPAGIAWAKRTFDTYPSAYANMAARKTLTTQRSLKSNE